MPTDFTKCQLSPSGNVITCKGRIGYADGLLRKKLIKGETDMSKAKFGATLVIPKGGDLTLLNAKVEECAAEKWGKDYKTKYKVKKPFLKTEDSPKIGLDPAEFPFLIRPSSDEKPDIVTISNPKLRLNDEQAEDQVYSGRWAAFSVRPYCWDHPTGGKGVSLGLHNVILLDNDEPLGRVRVNAEQEFQAIEGVAEGAGPDALFE